MLAEESQSSEVPAANETPDRLLGSLSSGVPPTPPNSIGALPRSAAGEVKGFEFESKQKSILFGGEDDLEEEEDEDEAMPSVDTGVLPESNELISRITSSPYPHHTTGPTSSRYRNALGRVASHPESDVEAWQALITEAGTCYRELLPSLHSIDADKHSKLDWMESCYGTFLKHFPYASNYYVTIAEMLLAQSARHGEQDGPLLDLGLNDSANSQRARRCEAKVDNIFQRVLGVSVDGTRVDEQHNNITAMCASSVELWLLFIRKCVRDVNRQAATMAPSERPKLIRERTVRAYEVAIRNASFVYNNHLLWKQYLGYVKSWIPDPTSNADNALAQQQMIQLRSVYQRLVTHPMTGLDQLWQEYEAFERAQSEALAQALFSEYTPKYQHARTVYLERNRVFSVVDLQLGRLAVPPVDVSDEDYPAKMEEEQKLLKMWKTRISYERTNPERLSPTDLSQRIRHAYREMVCVLTRHPEVWHMWSTYELLGSGASSKERGRLDCAVAVLQLAQEHIRDCTLLAYSEAHMIELHSDKPKESMQVMEKFLERNPNSLGFVLHQQMVRRYKGINAARAVFAKARRVLCDPRSRRGDGENSNSQQASDTAKEAADAEGGVSGPGGGGEMEENGKRVMVTNRLDPGIGTMSRVGMETDSGNLDAKDAEKTEGEQQQATLKENGEQHVATPAKSGPVTWHLYASHANIEHRLNGSPEVAARVFELGLRKHSSFLTKPPYVLRYAQLLLELQDTVNLRALLTRAVAACESQDGKGDAVAALWDMTLRFESLISSGDASNMPSLVDVERRRRSALMGEDVEDVSTGGFIGVGDTAVGIGAQKSTIAEQLIRADGYDVSSNVVNGMSRIVDVLDVMGVWGSGDCIGTSSLLRIQQVLKGDVDEDISGSKSDASYQRRLRFQSMAAMGLSSGPMSLSDGGLAATGHTKMLTARERLQQHHGGVGGVMAAANQAQTNAVALAIQQSPEWIRPLLLLLPASRMRLSALNKPPPHLTEMALLALRQNPLPAERPTGGNNKFRGLAGAKHKMDTTGGGDDSSDDDGATRGGGGYGVQFRSRQRARQLLSSGKQNGVDQH